MPGCVPTVEVGSKRPYFHSGDSGAWQRKNKYLSEERPFILGVKEFQQLVLI